MSGRHEGGCISPLQGRPQPWAQDRPVAGSPPAQGSAALLPGQGVRSEYQGEAASSPLLCPWLAQQKDNSQGEQPAHFVPLGTAEH